MLAARAWARRTGLVLGALLGRHLGRLVDDTLDVGGNLKAPVVLGTDLEVGKGGHGRRAAGLLNDLLDRRVGRHRLKVLLVHHAPVRHLLPVARHGRVPHMRHLVANLFQAVIVVRVRQQLEEETEEMEGRERGREDGRRCLVSATSKEEKGGGGPERNVTYLAANHAKHLVGRLKEEARAALRRQRCLAVLEDDLRRVLRLRVVLDPLVADASVREIVVAVHLPRVGGGGE